MDSSYTLLVKGPSKHQATLFARKRGFTVTSAELLPGGRDCVLHASGSLRAIGEWFSADNFTGPPYSDGSLLWWKSHSEVTA